MLALSGGKPAARGGKPTIWTPARLDQMAAWLADGASYGEIAMRLNDLLGGASVSRDAVAGACRYHGLRPPGPPRKAKSGAEIKARPEPAAGAGAAARPEAPAAGKDRPAKPRRRAAPAAGPGAGSSADVRVPRASALQLGVHCQFIAGRPTADDSCKCGKPVHAEGAAYCAEHHALCHQGRSEAAA